LVLGGKEYSVSLLGGIRSRRILLLCGFRNLDVLDANHVDFLLASKYVALVLRYTKVVIFVVKKTNTRMISRFYNPSIIIHVEM
jgi:hypothetical protein